MLVPFREVSSSSPNTEIDLRWMGWDVGVGSQGLQLEAQESLVGSFTLTPLSPTTSSVLRRRCLLRHRMDHLVGAIKKDARDVNPPLPRPAAVSWGCDARELPEFLRSSPACSPELLLLLVTTLSKHVGGCVALAFRKKKGQRKRCVFGWMISAVETKDGWDWGKSTGWSWPQLQWICTLYVLTHASKEKSWLIDHYI